MSTIPSMIMVRAVLVEALRVILECTAEELFNGLIDGPEVGEDRANP